MKIMRTVNKISGFYFIFILFYLFFLEEFISAIQNERFDVNSQSCLLPNPLVGPQGW